MWFAPFAGVVVLAGILGFQMGQPVGETEIIEAVAQRYVTDFNGELTDCHATSGETDGVRLLITCRKSDGRKVQYSVGERGRILQIESLAPEA